MRVAIIPARGGSRRIPRKNIRLFHGKPIMAYSIEVASESELFERIVVSTEDDEIADIALQYGAEVMRRPLWLADDRIGTQAVMQYIIRNQLTPWPDQLCCIYPCAPMLSAETLRKAAILLTPGTPYVVPVATWLRDPGQFYFGNGNAFDFGAALNVNGTKILWIDPNTECDINDWNDWHRAEDMYAKLHGIQQCA